MTTSGFTRQFGEIAIGDIGLVGGKNASLGEMYRELLTRGINVPDGFAVTSDAYWALLEQDGARERIKEILSGLDTSRLDDLKSRGKRIRDIVGGLPLPAAVAKDISAAYRSLCAKYGADADVAVRSSATAEDLPGASFAGQQETFLNVRGEADLFVACKRCFASLFTDRAISYRVDKGFDHMSVALSIGVQKMVRSDLACSGVMFSIDTESGFEDVVLINGAYGLGENVVKGAVNPDEFYVFKPTLLTGSRPIVSKALGTKKIMMVYQEDRKDTTVNVRVPRAKRERFVLEDDEILTLARWACIIEDHYSAGKPDRVPMDIEWGKDGMTGELYVLQARPETVVATREKSRLEQYSLGGTGELVVTGRAVGQKVGSGQAALIRHARDIEQFREGRVLVTENTDPDWEPVMKMASAIVTDKGGRTSHAAIVSRELGIPCIVGCGDATRRVADGDAVTVSCCEGDIGKVYKGEISYTRSQVELSELPPIRTKMALNIGSPDNAFALSFLPNDGVGLVRIEFIISSHIRAHPRALIDFATLEDVELKARIEDLTAGYADKSQFFVDRLAEGVGRIAAAFYPKPVIVRLSDFKSNEYAHLLGGELYEPREENPMIGWRGASRYYHPSYRAGFDLECRAMKKVREEFGLVNVKLMIPFCRTPLEARRVLDAMAENGLAREARGLEVYAMCEIPSNVLLADEFLEILDGFSIGSNDLTQLTLGLDRDSAMVSELFDERNEAVKKLIREAISAARKRGKYVGICGDAPSTFPDFAAFLVECGIDTISISPDALLRTRAAIAEEEKKTAGGRI